MNTLLIGLREAVQSAYNRSAFYSRLYGAMPEIESMEDFQRLPSVTRQLLAEGDAPLDFACIDDQQLVMELNEFSPGQEVFPLTPLENEYDMDRRYRRITRTLRFASANPHSTAIVCDGATMYFAAEIERVLPWPVVIGMRSDNQSAHISEALNGFGIETVILATRYPLAHLPQTCTALITFNGNTPLNAALPVGCRVFDVCTISLIPWFAVSDNASAYASYDALPADDVDAQRQFYLERGPTGTLVVTALHPAAHPGAMSIIRFDTGIRITQLRGASFIRSHVANLR